MSDENLNEKVDVDARKGEYHRTVERLSVARQMREAKTKGNKWNGLYDDGSGKGASVPEPIDFSKENRQRYSVEIDGRTRGFREAMQRVEMYKKLREVKKKTLMGNVKESVDEAAEPVVEAGAILIKDKFAMSEGDLSPAQKKYRAFFNKALKKFGADSPADLDDAKKKELFNYVKKNYKAEDHDILPPHGKMLDEEELSKKQKEYRAFFDKALKKFGASSPAKMDDTKKKEFFSYVKANWKG
jgi:hypothetical protein